MSDFLLARAAEDEALAERSVQVGNKGAALMSFGRRGAPPVLVMQPDRVLAECDRTRRIVAYAAPFVETMFDIEVARHMMAILRLLALPYADHPDYQDEWKPDGY